MQPHALMLILATAVGTAQAGCYTSGHYWPLISAASRAADSVCDSTVAGDFSPGQYKWACVNLVGGVRGEFAVQWKGNGNAFISDADCAANLKKEIVGCSQGGETVYGNWFFKSDPQGGVC